MLLLSYFDRIVGPLVFLTNPHNLRKNLDADHVEQIASFLNSEQDGFFTHTFSPELKTANWVFDLDSKWARGRSELALISAIVSEEEPDYAMYEQVLAKFVDKIKKIPDVYKAFYINKGPVEEKDKIQEKFSIIKEELNNLYKILVIKNVETEGQLINFERLKKEKIIGLSEGVIKKLNKLINNKQNCFMVFRTRGEAMKLDIIPVEADKIFNLVIMFGEQMTVSILQQISRVFSKFEDEISLIFTSGICQEVDKCLYEVFINTEMEKLNAILDEIYRISGIIEIDVKLIESKNN
ncbi:MAG: hypothetical protein EU539_06530 [Promethearchaeota archaeon]|nr:MAG: hypothetical protein EU539_06530 [Candidatus Lokiarchaeota archaeon]